jgi:hypothetical protein
MANNIAILVTLDLKKIVVNSSYNVVVYLRIPQQTKVMRICQ